MIHAYPGMGATSAMYPDPWRKLPNSVFHDWPAWKGEKTIEALAERLIQAHRIGPGDTLIGASLGGMVACEIANRVVVERLILVGSAVKPQEVSRWLRTLHPLARVAPFRLARGVAAKYPHWLTAQYVQSDPRFVRAMCLAIFRWNGLRRSVAMTRIHGGRDRIIPLPDSVPDPIEDGGHLIAMTHPKECVDRIARSRG